MEQSYLVIQQLINSSRSSLRVTNIEYSLLIFEINYFTLLIKVRNKVTIFDIHRSPVSFAFHSLYIDSIGVNPLIFTPLLLIKIRALYSSR